MYKTKLYENELNKINNLEVFKTTKKALMSIYSYFLKLGANKEEGLKISFDDIFDRYKRWHIFAKTKANFVKLSYKLIDLGLLTVEKVGNKNIYFARKESINNLVSDPVDNLSDSISIEREVKEEVNKEVKVKKPLLPSINIGFEEGEVTTQILNTKTNYYYITKDTQRDNILPSSKEPIEEDRLSNYEKAIIKNNKEKLNSSRAFGMGVEILAEKNIKTEKIREKVLGTLLYLDNVIVKKNARAYIEKMIENACAWYEKRRIAYATKVKSNKGSSSNTSSSYFNNTIHLSEMTLEEIDHIWD